MSGTGDAGRLEASMASVPRRLREAVVDSLHPAKSTPPAEATRTLREFLSGGSEAADAVYMEVLDRCTAEPLSPGVVANALRLLKSILALQMPSGPVLEAILAFADEIPARLLSVPSVRPGVACNQEIRQGLLYIQALVRRQLGDGLSPSADALSVHGHPISHAGSLASSSSTALYYSSAKGAASAALRPSVLLLLQQHEKEQNQHHRSVSEGAIPGPSRRSAAAPSASNLSAADLAQLGQAPAAADQGLQDGSIQFVRHLFNASLGGTESIASEAVAGALEAAHPPRDGGSEIAAAPEPSLGCGAIPRLCVASSAMATRYTAEDATDRDSFHEVQWGLARMPEAASSLAPMLMEVGQDSFQPPSELGAYEEAEQCVAVTDAEDARHNIAIVASVQRAQALSEGGANDAKDRPMNQMSSMLFQYRPYSEQMPLRLSQADVAAVVEAVKGEQPGSSTSPAGPELALEGSVLWGKSVGRGSMASVCSSLLMKVVMDLWLDAGSAVSFPVVLEMLQDMVYSERPHLQERAFDIIYNLSLHAQLLHPADPGTVASEPAGAAGLGRVEAVEAWLRRLLFTLLPILSACRTQPEEVWAAALGALLHLTTSGGAWHAPFVCGLSLSVVRALLQATERFSWSPELYCHLVRLAAHLMYEDQAAGEGSAVVSSEAHAAAEAESVPRTDLNLDNLEAFGGGRALIATFMAAPSPEARSNVFCLLFDLAVARLKGRQGAGGSFSADAVAAVAALIQRTELVQVMRPLILCQQPGIAQQLAEWVKELLAHGRSLHMSWSEADVPEAQPEEPRIKLLQAILEEIEAIAAAVLSGRVPRTLSGVVEATLAAVAGARSDGSSAAAWASGAWDCLRDLLWSPDPDVASLGTEWLSQLLVAAADEHMEAMWDATAGEESIAVLPALPQGGGVSALKSKGLSHQLELSALLAATLGPDCPGGGPPRLVLAAVERLLHRLKVGYPDDLESPSGSQEATRNHLNARLSCSILATLELAVEWILSAPPSCRQPALLRASMLLLSLLCIPSHLCMGRPSGAGDSSGCPWGAPQLDAASEIQAFLGGQVSVPISVLKLVPLGLLVRLFGNLLADSGGPDDAVHRLCFRGLSCSDLRSSSAVDWAFMSSGSGWAGNVRSALLLLVIGRCSVETTTLKMLGGEGWFHRLLNDPDPNVRYYSAVFLLKRLMSLQPTRYHKALHRLLLHAQQTDDHGLLKNPYLQMSAMLEMKLVDG